jgi:hypothetical protein
MNISSPRLRFFKQNYKKDCPMCSHCGVVCHTVEKCYRVHGFPPDFKFTQNRPLSHSTNQVQMRGTDLSGPHSQGTDLSGHQSHASQFSSPQLSMIFAQCQQLMNLLNQLQIPHPSSTPIVGNSGILNPKHSFFFFFFFSTYVNIASHSNLKNHTWIIDTRASDHMINCSSMFTTIVDHMISSSSVVINHSNRE